MSRTILMSLKIAAVYMGAVVGAGFATGQEIYYFFARFGTTGLAGTLLAGCLFALYGSFVLAMAARYRCENYRELLNELMGQKVAMIFDLLSFMILFCGNGIMLAGSGAIFTEHIGLNGLVGIFISLAVTFYVVTRGLDGLLVANSILVPIKFLCVVIVAGAAIALFQGDHGGQGVLPPGGGAVLGSTVLYVSYNLVIPLAVLSSLGKFTPSEVAIGGGVLGGLGLGLAAYLIAAAEYCFYPGIQDYQLPLLYIASKLSPVYGTVLCFLIWAAILTTLISNTHGMASRLAQVGSGRYKIIGVLVLLLALPLAKFEFAFLVKLLYPLFGYVGLIMLFYLTLRMLYELKGKLTERNPS